MGLPASRASGQAKKKDRQGEAARKRHCKNKKRKKRARKREREQIEAGRAVEAGVCARSLVQDEQCQISGQKRMTSFAPLLTPLPHQLNKVSIFRHACPRPSRSLPLAQAAMGVRLLSCFHALLFVSEAAHKRAGDGPRQGSHRLGLIRGVMADSKRPHTFTEGAMSDARADYMARDVAAARSVAL